MLWASWFNQWTVDSDQSVVIPCWLLSTVLRAYRPFLLDALSGLILAFLIWFSFVVCVAKLQLPFFHLTKGSGQAVQYHPEENSEARLHPWHSSTVGWQPPPLKEQPFFVIKMHSNPFFTLVQTIGITPFPSDVINDCQSAKKSWRFYQPVLGLSTRLLNTFGNVVSPGPPCS